MNENIQYFVFGIILFTNFQRRQPSRFLLGGKKVKAILVCFCWCATGFKGQKGAQGQKGDQGFDGDQGEEGLTGEKGMKGDQGPQGERGLRGPKGITGLTGLSGNKGKLGSVVVVPIRQTSAQTQNIVQ